VSRKPRFRRNGDEVRREWDVTAGCQCAELGDARARLCSETGAHATEHFRTTRHPVIEGYDPPEGWGWCYVDEALIDLSENTTPQVGPLPRYY